MRGRKGVPGGVKEGTRVATITAGRTATTGAVKGLGATGARLEASHGGPEKTGRKVTGGTRGTHK